MNLVDAIRMAGAKTNDEVRSTSSESVVNSELRTPSSELALAPIPDPQSPNPEMPMQSNFVRIELFLSPDQIQGLLKETVGSHRTIMTVREVAHLLRTTSHNVERLAEEGKLPGFQLDDSWRFHKSAIDEWMAHQSNTDAA